MHKASSPFKKTSPLSLNRRAFLGWTAAGLLAGLTEVKAAPLEEKARVGLVKGADRAQNIYDALKRIEPDIRRKLATKKRILIKPNLVHTQVQLSASHAECIEGMLEFFRSISDKEILIAETPANGPAAEAYENYGYGRLEKAYKVRLLDLDHEPHRTEYVINERHHPQAVRFSTRLLDPEALIISAAQLKTHDRAVVTLGLKNLAVGAILKDPQYTWDKKSKGQSDKHLVHGGKDNQGIHYNLFKLARTLSPALTVLDGFVGMEHNGPVGGTPIEHGVALASTDWLAADSVGLRLMGFDFEKVGYLTFAARAGMGESDPEHMEILGPGIAEVAKPYRPHDSIEKQYGWQ